MYTTTCMRHPQNRRVLIEYQCENILQPQANPFKHLDWSQSVCQQKILLFSGRKRPSDSSQFQRLSLTFEIFLRNKRKYGKIRNNECD